MKKGLLVVCTMISILLQVVSFSFPVKASSGSQVVNNISGRTPSIYISGDTARYLVATSGSSFYNNSVSNSGFYGYVDVVVPIPSPLNITGDIVQVWSSPFTVTPVWANESDPAPDLNVTSVEMWLFDSHTSVSRTNGWGGVFDNSWVGGNLFSSFFLRVYFYVDAGFYKDGDSAALKPKEGIFAFDFSCASMTINWLDSGKVTVSDVQNQTTEINNQINQSTETVTDGYDNSQIEQSNTQLADSMQDYDSQQAEITDQATGYIDDVAFVDPSSQVQLAAAITYSASWLQSLFVNLGDWGILVVVSLSLAFAFMLIGWYKYRK